MQAPMPPERFLGCPTPDAWCDAALADLDTLLIDHAYCEKKAASTALALMFRYPERPRLIDRLSRLAREELRHFEQVQKLMRGRGVRYRRLTASRYAEGLRRAVRGAEPARLVDTLVVGAFIEARSCERFAKLAPRLPTELGEFYRGLCAAEARHFQDYLALAGDAASEEEVVARAAAFRVVEEELVTAPDPQFRFHSGPPIAA